MKIKMNNKNLNMLIRSYVSSEKLTVSFYCIFTTLATILVLISVGIISPLKYNIDNKINNHILNREITAQFGKNMSDDEINDVIINVKNTEHVVDMYQVPAPLAVSEESGVLFSEYNLSYIHRGFTPTITNGKIFDESETQVAVVPETISDFNESEHKIVEINGGDLIGKTLVFRDECNNEHRAKIVGTYDTSDPIFTGKEILIPRQDLLDYNEAVLNSPQQGYVSISSDKSYKILIDDAKNTDSALSEVSDYCVAYKESLSFDADSFNVALYILIASLISFLALVVIGFFLFLKNNVDGRTEELALYRSLGYKSRHIFYILFSEHLLFGSLSIILGTAASVLICVFAVNPFLDSLVGNTIMAMNVNITIAEVFVIFLFFSVVLFVVCRKAVKRSEKIDLTVLLREK